MWRGMFAIPVIVAGLYNNVFLSSILKQWVKSSSDSSVDTKNMESFNPWECVCLKFWVIFSTVTELIWTFCLGRHSSALQQKVNLAPLGLSDSFKLYCCHIVWTVWTHKICIIHYKVVHARTETKPKTSLHIFHINKIIQGVH